MLLLLARCALLALLALAFARPFFKQVVTSDQDPGAGQRTALLIDVSASMRRAGLWDQCLAKAKAVTPEKRNIQINFGGHKAGVRKAYLAPQGDLALVRLKTPMNNWTKVALLNKPLTKKDGMVKFTFVGHSGRLHFHRNRKARGTGLNARHLTTKKDNPGKAGDSGGAWVIERKGQHVLVAVIHGGGVGTQPAALRKWIDQTMKSSGEKANWVGMSKGSKKKPKK